MSTTAAESKTALEDVNRDDVLDVFCDRARELFERQQQRVQQLEADLTCQIEAAIEEIEFSHAVVDEREGQFQHLDQKLAKLAKERDQALEARSEAELLLDEARAAISHVSHEQHDLRVQLSQCHKQLNARAEELKELRARLRESSGESNSQLAVELAAVEVERDGLKTQLAELESQLKEASSASPVDSSELDELRERFETAVQEIRELKRRNNELNDRLADPLSDEGPKDEVGGFDWEAQKRRLMMQLEEDFDESNPQQASDKLTVEGTIRITDQVIAEKDREIEDLQRLLEDQSSNIGNVGDMAVGAAAIAGFLDQDELISQERESLSRLQEEWREKLRQAEIDISVERARLGRERIELQGQLQTIDQQRQANQADSDLMDDKQPRGRWRKRLGLKDE